MCWRWTIVLSFFETVLCVNNQFPPWFQFGAASSAYQTEGAWNVSDKSRSIWDEVTHTRSELISDHTTGDVACDSYHLWQRDVQMAAELGLQYYRFSISWTRLLPLGFPNHISKDGQRFYSDLIDELLRNKIEPVVTLYHFDLPQSLQDLGGWTNPLISDWFAEYSRVAFKLFGDRVKIWITINEPIMFCGFVYNMGVAAPPVKSKGIGDYLCIKHAVVAHAKSWRIYDEEFRPKHNGKISLTNHVMWFEPAREGEEDAADLMMEYACGMYADPIFSKEGGWPKSIENIIAQKSREEGFLTSRLPAFTPEEIEFVRGTFDFFGLNYYTARQVDRAKDGDAVGDWPLMGAPELNLHMMIDPRWNTTGWFAIVPHGIRKLLQWIQSRYGDVEVFIGENGYLSLDTGLDDRDRVAYFESHLEQVLLAVYEDGVNVTHYTAWSLMDNFEWIDGYHSNYGLYAVDFSDPLRPRTPRSSASYYTHVVRARSLDVPKNFTPYVGVAGGRTLCGTLLVLSVGVVFLF